MNKIALKSPAKVNLFLEILRKRRDSFHELATVFAKINLFDSVEISKRKKGGIVLSVRGNRDLGPGTENTVHRAAAAFLKKYGIRDGVSVVLDKKIPAGAGLGGGSGNAACVLRGLCELFGVDFRKNFRVLTGLAAEIGSDVPFFLRDETFCAGRGRGEKLTPFNVSPRKEFLVVVYPGKSMSTKSAYSMLAPPGKKEIEKSSAALRELTKRLERGEPLKNCLFNRLERAVFRERADIKKLKDRILMSGADSALMSGSGSSVFGIFGDKASAERAVRTLKTCKNGVFLAKFL